MPWRVDISRVSVPPRTGEWVHSVSDQKIYLIPNGTAAAAGSAGSGGGINTSSTIAASKLEQIVAVVGSQQKPAVGITLSGFKLRHSASHYTGPYPTCGGGDFCAARTGTVYVSGAENVTLSNLDIDRASSSYHCP